MKKYKMFNKGAPEKEKLDFAEFPCGKWNDSGHGSEPAPNESPSDLRVATKRGEVFPSSGGNPNQNPTAPYNPQNGQHYDRYHITQGELSDKVGITDPSSNVAWSHTYDQPQKAGGSSQVSSELHERLKQRVSSGSQVSSECDSNESWQNNSSAAESSAVMKVALGEIGSISKYVSQGTVSVTEMLTPSPAETSGVPATQLEGEEESNIEMQPELTITNAFSLSAEMWDTGQDQKPEEEPVESESRNPVPLVREEFPNSDQNLEEKTAVTDPEAFDLSKVKKEIEEEPFSCSHCGMVTSDSASLQEHMKTHTPPKKTKVYLHQCSVPGCVFSTNVIREFISHYSLNHEGLSSYVCRWCKSAMNSLSVFVDHVKENFVVPWVKCPHCHLKKKNKSEVVEHISKEHPGESQRVIAGSMFLCRSSSHSRDKDSKVFTESHKTLVSLLNNQKYILNSAIHNGNDNILDPSLTGQGYQCPDCAFNTTNAQVFLAHIKVCESMKTATKQKNVNFECKECSFATSSREAFLNHSHVKASLMNGMKRAPYKKRPVEVRNELIRKKILNIKKQTLALKLKKDREAMDLEASKSGENEASGGHFKFSCPYCSEKFPKLNRMKFHIFLSHRDNYSQTFPLHQCLSCHMKSSSEEIVRQHIERTHFGRKSGILLINEPPEIIPRKYKGPPDPNKKLVKSIAPIIKLDPGGAAAGETSKKPNERCSSWGRNQTLEESKLNKASDVISPETVPKNAENVIKHPVSTAKKETPCVDPKTGPLPPEPTVSSELVANQKQKEEPSNADTPKNLAMEIVKFTAGDHFTEYIQCPRCSYQSRSVMGFYGHIKRHLDLVVHINTRRKYEFHKPKSNRAGQKTEGGDGTEEPSSTEAGPKPEGGDVTEGIPATEAPSNVKKDEEAPKDDPEEPEAKEALSPMSPTDPEIKPTETTPLSTAPPKLESIIINKKSENLIDKDEYSKLGGPILDAKLSSLYTCNGQVKVCNICDYMADFPCYIHRHLLSAHLNIHFWECGHCFYRHLQRHKVIRHCTRNHANREPYAKWLGIPDWEKKLADCSKKTTSDGSKLPDLDVSSDTNGMTPAPESPLSPSTETPTITETPAKAEKFEPTETVKIEKLPGNLFKCGRCTMCSIHADYVLRHVRYHHKAEGLLPKSEMESGMSGLAVVIPKKTATPSKPTPKSAQSTSSVPPTTPATVSSPALKKSPAGQADIKKPSEPKTKTKKKVAPITIPKTPYRCVFCNYVNMSATEVKKHMWREHSDELNNVGILLKSKEEGEKAPQSSAKSKGEGSNAQKGPPIKRKLKRTYRPHKRKKTKTYSKCVKEPGKKKSLAKPSDSGLADPPVKKAKKPVHKDLLNREAPLEFPVEDSMRKRPASDLNNESPVMPKKRQIQSTQHSDYEWESPSLAEPPNSRSERIYKSVDRTEELSQRMLSSYSEKTPAEKETAFKFKSDTLIDVPSPQENYPARQKEEPSTTYNLNMPVFRKAEMDIYKRFIFKTYDGTFLCNYCLISMNDEIEARHHILRVHPKKPTNPLEQPCKTFQLFRKKTRRPEIIVPHASQPRLNQKQENKVVKKKGVTKKKMSPARVDRSVTGMKKENRASLFDLFENISDKNPGSEFRPLTSGRFDDHAEQALLKAEYDIPCVFSWKWANLDDKNNSALQHLSDSQQISILRLITYRQSKNVTGHFKCPFCQMMSTSHVRISDHIRVDHMELQRHKCEECSFKSWFLALVENHKKLQHVTSLPTLNEESQTTLPKESQSLTKDDSTLSMKDKTNTEPMVQASLVQQPCGDGSKMDRATTDMIVVTDYRTLYLRTYCQRSQAVMYMCTICSQMLSNQKSFFDHVTSHYGRIYQCTVCSYKTYPRESMDKHLQIHRQSPKPSLIALHHEHLLNVDVDPQSDQIPKPVMDIPLISEHSLNEKPLPDLLGPESQQNPSHPTLVSSKLTKHLTFCCSECPSKLKGLKAFSQHLDHHYKQTNWSIKATSAITDGRDSAMLLSPVSAADDPHNLYSHRLTPVPQKSINFDVCVNLNDMFSFYSDNVFSYYS